MTRRLNARPSDHVEQIEQDDDRDRNAESPEQNAAHFDLVDCNVFDLVAPRGGTMADRITIRWLSQAHPDAGQE
jgi:hypothetical protein